MQEATAHYVAHLREDLERAQRQRSIDSAIAGARKIAKSLPAGEDATALIRRDRNGDYGNARDE